jgi:predicted RNA binding protein YcfA (HicA-like mRNA interferase family)
MSNEPSKLPRITGKQAVKALCRAGFEVRRIKGSHHILKRTNPSVTVVVPVHGNETLPTGTVLSILRHAGITAERLVELL